MNRLPLYLIVFIVAAIVLSNTFADGTTVGGIVFVMWAAALLLLIGLGVRSLVRRGERT